jgi:hypothetical protein
MTSGREVSDMFEFFAKCSIISLSRY